MKRVLVTGGTVFVSKYVAKYFESKNYEVFVLNRGTKEQVENVNLICADRNNLKDSLSKYSFDAVIDVCAYNQKDIKNILDGKVNVNEIERLIQKSFNTNAYVTKRLVENEFARCQNEINDYFANTYGLEHQLFAATLDNKTTDKCRGLDGKIFEVNDPDKPRIPQDTHILCRSCYINLPSREWKPKTRMDNITKNNDGIWKDYTKWYQENKGE